MTEKLCKGLKVNEDKIKIILSSQRKKVKLESTELEFMN